MRRVYFQSFSAGGRGCQSRFSGFFATSARAHPWQRLDRRLSEEIQVITGRRWLGRGRPHPRPASQAGGKIIRALGSPSVGQDVFVVGHGIHVVAWFAGPWPSVRVRRGAGWGEDRRAVPLAQVVEDFFDHLALVNDRNHPHLMLALWADQRVGVPHLQDQVAPLFGGQFGGRWTCPWTRWRSRSCWRENGRPGAKTRGGGTSSERSGVEPASGL